MVEFMTAVSGRIARASDRSGNTPVVAVDIPKVFDRTWHVGFLQKVKFYGIQVRFLTLF